LIFYPPSSPPVAVSPNQAQVQTERFQV
jgi:hypothetical protein